VTNEQNNEAGTHNEEACQEQQTSTVESDEGHLYQVRNLQWPPVSENTPTGVRIMMGRLEG